jgi:hypothetical protein
VLVEVSVSRSSALRLWAEEAKCFYNLIVFEFVDQTQDFGPAFGTLLGLDLLSSDIERLHGAGFHANRQNCVHDSWRCGRVGEISDCGPR